jgi:hypothetical protein
MPPRIPIFIAIQTITLVLAALAPPLAKELSRVPQRTLIALQSIRVIVELCLLALAANQLLPWEMTLEGRNFDMVVGITAPLLAAFAMVRGPLKARALIITWNLIGMAILTVVVAHGMLSMPYPSQVLKLHPSPAALAEFPLQLLPFFIVPAAYFLHLISLRKAITNAPDGYCRATLNADGTPQLQAPGKGLPFFEGLVVRWVLGPALPRMMSWDKATAVFNKENSRVLALAEGLSAEQLTRRVLVPPMQGLEDSSRNWSAIMVLEHLLITHEGMKTVLLALSHGKTLDHVVDTAKVKPAGERSPQETLADFKRVAASLTGEIDGSVGDRNAPQRHLHPWLGPLTAHGWHNLMPMHTGIHRRQLQAIVKGLK